MEKHFKDFETLKQIIFQETSKSTRFILYGDADLDGVSSVIILKETLELLNPKYKHSQLKIYFPDRERDGYGITQRALSDLKKEAPGIFVALDCGITNFKEVKEAQKLGFRVIIIDHHQVLEKLPEAEVIINPKRKDDPYPFKLFSTAGIVYKVCKGILIESNISWRPEAFLELVALATLADQMPLQDENKKLVEEGLRALEYTQRLGIQVLKEITQYQEGNQIDLFQKIIAPLNSSERRDHLTESFILLTTQSPKIARIIAQDLYQKSLEKKERINQILEEVEKRIQNSALPIIYEGDPSWPTVLIGIVASKLLQKYKKPTFLFKIQNEESICSARLPKGYDGVEALKYCSELLETYGGHPPACGCRLKTQNLEKFKEKLIEYFQKHKLQQ